MLYKSIDLEVTDLDHKKGIFAGRFASFVTVDACKELMQKGSFKKSIDTPSIRRRIKTIAEHKLSLGIGVPSYIEEREDGAYHETKVIDTDFGINALKLIEGGFYDNHSFGYAEDDYEMVKGIRHVKDITLWEISVLPWGMNWDTPITEIKSLDDFVAPRLERLKELQSFVHKTDFIGDETPAMVEHTLMKAQGEINKLISDFKAYEGRQKVKAQEREKITITTDAEAPKVEAGFSKENPQSNELSLMKKSFEDAKKQKAALSFENVDLGILMHPLGEPVRQQLIDIANSIEADDIYDVEGYGRIDGSSPMKQPHLTLLYGLHEVEQDKLEAFVREQPQMKFDLWWLSYFETDDYDVLYVHAEGEDLYDFNYEVQSEFPNTVTHGYYTPHVKIAYLKKGTIEKYVYNNRYLIDVRNLEITEVEYRQAGSDTGVMLELSPKESVEVDILVHLTDMESLLWSLMWAVDDLWYSKSLQGLMHHKDFGEQMTSYQAKTLIGTLERSLKQAHELHTDETKAKSTEIIQTLKQQLATTVVEETTDTNTVQTLDTTDFDLVGELENLATSDHALDDATHVDDQALSTDESAQGAAFEKAMTNLDKMISKQILVGDMKAFAESQRVQN